MDNINQIPVPTVITPQVKIEQSKKTNFLVILLSTLLIISVVISGFFAFQTQKLVKELTLLRTEPTPMATVEPTTEAVATNSLKTVDPTADWKVYTNTMYGFSFKYPSDKFITTNLTDDDMYFDTNKNGGSPMELGSNDIWLNIHVSKITESDKAFSKEFIQVNSAQNISAYQTQKITNNNLYKINMSSFSSNTIKNNEALFDQILSTFKFTN